MTDGELFLGLLKKATRNLIPPESHELALWCLLDSERKNVLLLLDHGHPFQFHKSFRQIDVTDSGQKDMAIWHLLDNAKIFWEVFHEVWPLREK